MEVNHVSLDTSSVLPVDTNSKVESCPISESGSLDIQPLGSQSGPSTLSDCLLIKLEQACENVEIINILALRKRSKFPPRFQVLFKF